jgi:hypothetical protein
MWYKRVLRWDSTRELTYTMSSVTGLHPEALIHGKAQLSRRVQAFAPPELIKAQTS